MATFPSWWGKERQDRNFRSRKQEEKIARDQGGRPTPGSGSSWRSPGDVTKAQTEVGEETFLTEAKFTDKKGYHLDARVIRNHWKKAHSLGKEPVMVIEFSGCVDPSHPGCPPLRVMVIPYDSHFTSLESK